METFEFQSEIDAPAEEVFNWHTRPGAFQRLAPPWQRIELIEQTNGIAEGSQVVFRLRAGPFRLKWVALHREYREGRLFQDERVPVWTKLIPPAALLYVLSPIDFIPDVVAGLGQLDDIAVVLIGMKLFIELAPRDVVREHLAALGARVQEWRVVDDEPGPARVIDGELHTTGPESLPPDED